MNIENKKQILIILLALALGLIAAILTGGHIQGSIEQETARLAQNFEKQRIEPLLQEMKAMQKAMKRLEERQASMPAASGPGAPVQGTPAPPKSTLALKTPGGKRAYTVLIDSLSAVGGLVSPGDYVDIIVHMNVPDPITEKKTTVSSMVFQNIQILAVGTNLQAPGGYEQQQRARSLNITFALTPEEASLMSFVEKNGKMQLVLRAPSETETEIMQVSSWKALADYVFESQGTELPVPRGKALIETTGEEDVEPFIQIYQGGKEL